MSKPIDLVPCTRPDQLEQVAALAERIWHEYFPAIISEDQINYMVDTFQSLPAMKEQIAREQYTYYQIRQQGALVGYVGLANQPEVCFLSKFYLSKEARGDGLATPAFQAVCAVARQWGKKKVVLTCNKHNSHSLDVYKHWGFQITDAVVTQIGHGYVRDDYILEYTL